MNFKELALKAEEEFDFVKALEYYEKAFNELCVEDGSLQKYANLLLEFQRYEKAREVLEILVQKTAEKQYMEKLAQVYEELGMTDLAALIYEKLGTVNPVKNDLKVNQIDQRVIKKFLELFSGREDVFAVQTSTGYYPVRSPMKERDIIDHLEGSKTIGVYPLRSDNCIKFAAFDVDLKDTVLKDREKALLNCQEVVKQICKELEIEGIKHYLEFSGNKGYHVWIFFNTWVQAYKVRLVLKRIVSEISIPEHISVEIFPKQSDTAGGLGNLIKLPLGVHRKTANRCVFVDKNLEPVSNQLEYLMKMEQNDVKILERLYNDLLQQNSHELPRIDEPKNTQKNIKKIIRSEIDHAKTSDTINHVIQSCHVLNQIAEKIQKSAYITTDEEYILIAACGFLEESKRFLTSLLENTINYSQHRLEAILNSLDSIPISCEEIREQIVNKSIALSLERCNCKFKTVFNSPICFAVDCLSFVLQKVDVRDLVRKILDKTRKKTEIEVQIKTLKTILALKMTNDEIHVENMVVRKNNGEIQIIL
ncbi:CRISPR-associated primase-polymerase type A1 [Pseudothermotoga sp.]|nr:CRISPR-associated primase-polymerase type A1 [Pseudothermotoga sp.]MCX7812497.1 CRISPR-associated primase-polymerase type A1 [Pseudothermotoga sp.]MDW8140047.1 CRISPR-associated primase-polymerase type A1 [Pseudothermotoga sp.]